MKNWYCVCYDSQGDGFKHIDQTYCFAFGKKELKCAVEWAIKEFELDHEQICIFKLKSEKTEAEKKEWRDYFSFLQEAVGESRLISAMTREWHYSMMEKLENMVKK